MIAIRAQSALFRKQLYVVLWLVVSALPIIAITWTLEQYSQSAGHRKWTTSWLAAGLTVISLVAMALLYAWRYCRQKQIGTLFYFGEQFGQDTDIGQLQNIFNASRTVAFDTTLIERSNQIKGGNPRQIRRQMEHNLRYLLDPNDDGTPMNLVTNVPWSYGLALGWSLSAANAVDGARPVVDPEHFYVWHLEKRPDRRGVFTRWLLRQRAAWFEKPELVPFERSLVDVAHGERLEEPSFFATEDACKNAIPSYEEESPSWSGTEGERVVVISCTDKDFLPDKGVPLREKCHRYVGVEERTSLISADALELLARRIAAVLYEELEESGHPKGLVTVYARLPKPVPIAIGYCLGQRFGLGEEVLCRLRFARYSQADHNFVFDSLWECPPDRPKDMTIVNLTAHPITLLDANDDEVFVLPPSGVVARVTEKVVSTESLAVEGDIDAPIVAVSYAGVEGLPAPKSGVTYVVSRVTAAAVSNRNDLVFPHDERRRDGVIIGCRGFGRFA